MNKRYSIYIKPISIIANLVIINFFLKFFLKDAYLGFWHIAFTNLSWLIISYQLNFYNFRRSNKNIDILSLLFLQFLIFTFVYFAYYSLTNKEINAIEHIKILLSIFVSISLFRLLYLFALKKYRLEGKNLRNIIFIGSHKSARNLTEFFKNHSELGYQILGNFYNDDNENYLGSIDSAFDFISKNDVDEIYCSISDLTKSQIKSFIDYADNNLTVVKLLPNANDVFTTKMIVDYYDYIPVLSLRSIPFDKPINQFTKRLFDLIFSLIIIVFVLSWLTPILFVLIKIESKGPLFFKQTRDGINGSQFVCYKYRSMFNNKMADDMQATKHDKRVTKIGYIIRKINMDELPQFFNVLTGDMSVVGPRPHMLSQTKKYAKIVDKFMVRHFIKPGITGLAQVRGYRGEIEKNKDMGNRIKLDIFYIENWSFLLDLKIIVKTITNTLKGEAKAY